MMRWVLIALFLANVLYFSWEFNRQVEINRRNSVTAVQVSSAAGQLVLLSEDDGRRHTPRNMSLMEAGAADSGAGRVADFTPADADATAGETYNDLVIDLPDFSLSNSAPGALEPACFTFGPISEESLAVGLQDWFNSRRVSTATRFTDEQGRQLFWIYLAPQQSRDGAMETIQDLRDDGVSDYRLISRGNLENAISLGLFSSQASVNKRLYELKQKGYQPIVVPYSDGKRVYWLDTRLRNDPDVLARVFEGYPSRFNFVPVECGKIANALTKP